MKRLRQSEKRAEENKKIKANIDYLFRQLKKTLSEGNKEKATEYAGKLTKAIDKSIKRNIYKKNSAARAKSKMMKKVNALKK